MTRETAPYLLTPLDRKKPALFVLGPRLGPSYSELLAEVERLQGQVDNECRLRAQAQERLNRAMRVLASIGRAGPKTAAAVRAARREVYGRLP